MEIVPATGWIWTVWYRWDGEDVEAMTVAAITVEVALHEARYSLESGGQDYTILGIARDDAVTLSA